MTTTHQQHVRAETGGRVRRVSAVALASGGLLTGAALALHLRGGTEDVAFVRRVEAASQTWLAGHVLMAVGAILLLLGLLAVPGLARGRGRRIVLVGSVLAGVGAASTALGDFAHGALAYVLVGEVSAEQSLEIQDQFFTQPLLAAVTMPGLLLPLGLLVLGSGLLVSRAVPWAAASLLMVSPIAIQAGYSVTSLPMPLMVLPLWIGMAWVAWLLATRRT